MKSVALFIGSIVGVLLVVFALGFMIEGEDFLMYQYFAPKRANLERKVFENTHSYNKGMIQELQSMQFDYEKTTDPAAKNALGALILQRVAEYDETKLPPSLYTFVQSLR